MMKKLLLLFAIFMSLGAIAQDELLFDGSGTAPAQQLFRQGPSWNPVGSAVGAIDDGTGNMVIEINRTTNAGAVWHVLPLVDGAGQGTARNFGSGGTFEGLIVKVRTNKVGDASLSARLQNGSVRTPDVIVTGSTDGGTSFGPWQTIILDFSSITADTQRPEFYVDAFDSATNTPAAGYQIQFDDIIASVSKTLSVEDNSLATLSVFPNPTTNKITINTNQEFNSVTVYDITGKRVKSYQNTNELDVADIATGMYFLKTDTGLQAKFLKK